MKAETSHTPATPAAARRRRAAAALATDILEQQYLAAPDQRQRMRKLLQKGATISNSRARGPAAARGPASAPPDSAS